MVAGNLSARELFAYISRPSRTNGAPRISATDSPDCARIDAWRNVLSNSQQRVAYARVVRTPFLSNNKLGGGEKEERRGEKKGGREGKSRKMLRLRVIGDLRLR